MPLDATSQGVARLCLKEGVAIEFSANDDGTVTVTLTRGDQEIAYAVDLQQVRSLCYWLGWHIYIYEW